MSPFFEAHSSISIYSERHGSGRSKLSTIEMGNHDDAARTYSDSNIGLVSAKRLIQMRVVYHGVS